MTRSHGRGLALVTISVGALAAAACSAEVDVRSDPPVAEVPTFAARPATVCEPAAGRSFAPTFVTELDGTGLPTRDLVHLQNESDQECRVSADTMATAVRTTVSANLLAYGMTEVPPKVVVDLSANVDDAPGQREVILPPRAWAVAAVDRGTEPSFTVSGLSQIGVVNDCDLVVLTQDVRETGDFGEPAGFEDDTDTGLEITIQNETADPCQVGVGDAAEYGADRTPEQLRETPVSSRLIDGFAEQGDVRDHHEFVPAGGQVRLTIAWPLDVTSASAREYKGYSAFSSFE